MRVPALGSTKLHAAGACALLVTLCVLPVCVAAQALVPSWGQLCVFLWPPWGSVHAFSILSVPGHGTVSAWHLLVWCAVRRLLCLTACELQVQCSVRRQSSPDADRQLHLDAWSTCNALSQADSHLL